MKKFSHGSGFFLFIIIILYTFPIGMPLALLLAFYFYLFTFVFLLEFYPARVAELVDALDLKSSGLLVRGGSSPPPGTAKAGLNRLFCFWFRVQSFWFRVSWITDFIRLTDSSVPKALSFGGMIYLKVMIHPH